jgi:uncharacterized protein YbjT (DUF2867 family)
MCLLPKGRLLAEPVVLNSNHDRSSMTIAITGASGQLGTHVVTALERTGQDFRVIARSQAVSTDHETVIVPGGYDDPDGLSKALIGVERVFLMSTATPSRQPPRLGSTT